MGNRTHATLCYGFKAHETESSSGLWLDYDKKKYKEGIWEYAEALNETDTDITVFCTGTEYSDGTVFVGLARGCVVTDWDDEVTLNMETIEEISKNRALYDAHIRVWCEENGVPFRQPEWLLIADWC